ncbi:MAG: stage V sporulation protein AC [Clostridia bacterium]|nr:stage V sporulation protein AC [Clostridia bacterium]
MPISDKEYQQMTKKATPRSPVIINTLKAYAIGGLICAGGQGLRALYTMWGLTEENVKAAVPITLIVITAILTGLGVFDKIARHAGAGTVVPITGFANSMVSPALEFQSEGFVLGTAANMFKIAGPVIVYGTFAAFIYGVVYWIISLF